ncbi:MAG: acetylornithine deacetylase/succinyldiaminopimelate desuccinylase-like deacylase [Ardenticatenia bacterium]|jgi:putative selenium metabolism hydrolase|nr:MAG: acetylornithine deacetylase/succinyldiaminopimelate desuccinylase-like deacylase [Ardenticatenia bacterium]
MPVTQWSALAQADADALIAFAQRLVQTPSLPGHEEEVARLVEQEMCQLGYDAVTVDPAGNVVGWIRGDAGPPLMFNAHMDHVDPGDLSSWPHPPYSGAIVDGMLWGRGSVDMKGALAAMVYAGGLIQRHHLPLPGDLIVAAVVMEEGGGVGTHELLRHVRPALCVVGESSAGCVMRGHRGRTEFLARVVGRPVHASMPELGANPHYPMARFLARLETLPMEADAVFTGASVAPTLYRTDQSSPNVTPGEVRLTLDWRSLPSQRMEQVAAQLEALLREGLAADFQAEVCIVQNRYVTYTGRTVELPASFPSFLLPMDHWLVQGAQRTLSQALDRAVAIDVWRFATDGGQIAALGIPTIGFGPGDPKVVHTNHEHIAVTALVDALAGYAALASEMVRAPL